MDKLLSYCPIDTIRNDYYLYLFQEVHGVLANPVVNIGRQCFGGNPINVAFNDTVSFEEHLMDGDSFLATPVSRGVNTHTQWPSDLYYIPVLESNGEWGSCSDKVHDVIY